MLVAHPHRRDVGGLPRLEVGEVRRHGGDGDDRPRPIDGLDDHAAVGGRERFLLAQEEHRRVDEARALHLHRRLVGAEQKGDLVLDGDVERIDRGRAAPRAVGHGRGGREDDRPQPSGAVGARLGDGLLRDARDLVAREVATGGEAPRAADDHAHPEAERLRIGERLDASLAGEDVLIANAADAHVGILGAGGLGGVERAHGEFFEGGVAGIGGRGGRGSGSGCRGWSLLCRRAAGSEAGEGGRRGCFLEKFSSGFRHAALVQSSARHLQLTRI